MGGVAQFPSAGGTECQRLQTHTVPWLLLLGVCVCVKRIHDSGRRRSASLLSSGSTLTSVSEPCGRQTSASSLAVVVAAVHMGRHTHTTRREA